jgi:hypothetical protein
MGGVVDTHAWEYANIRLISGPRLGIVYAHPDGRVSQFPSSERDWPSVGDQSHRAMMLLCGLLGGGGWELLTVADRGDYRGAFFKRQAVDGRATDDVTVPEPLWRSISV